MEKLNTIEDKIDDLATNLKRGIEDIGREISAAGCRNSMTTHLTRLSGWVRYYSSSYLSAAKSYGVNSYTAKSKLSHLYSNMGSLSESVGYVLDSLDGSRYGCDILETIYDGDSKTGYMKGDPKAFSFALVALTDAVIGIQVISTLTATH